MKKMILILLTILSLTLYGSPSYDEVRRAAEKEDPSSQFTLAVMYYGGDQVEADYQEGLYWLKRSAENDYPNALMLLGYMTEWGLYTEADPRAAAAYYERAAYSGHLNISYKIALLHYYSLKDPVRARAWISIATRSGLDLSRGFQAEVRRSLSPSQQREAEKISNEIYRRIYKDGKEM